MKIEWGAILLGAVVGAAAGYVMGFKAQGGKVNDLLKRARMS